MMHQTAPFECVPLWISLGEAGRQYKTGVCPSKRSSGPTATEVTRHWSLSEYSFGWVVILSFAKTSAGGQVVDLSALILTQSRLDDHSPAPPSSPAPVPLRRPPPARPREPRPASATRRVQKDGDPAPASHDGSSFLGWASQDLDPVETAPRDRDSRHRPEMATAPLPRVLDPALRPADRVSPARHRRDQGPGCTPGHREPSLGAPRIHGELLKLGI